MFQTDWKEGKTAGNNDSVGTIPISNPTYVVDGDTSSIPARFSFFDSFTRDIVDVGARLVVDDVIVGDNEAVQNIFDPYNWETFVIGSTSNNWGLTDLTASKVKSSEFGIALSMGYKNKSGGAIYQQSNYLVVKGFNFAIPRNAIVTGVQLEVIAGGTYAGPGVEYGQIQSIRVRLTYDFDFIAIGQGESYGFIKFNEQEEPEINQSKSYQYLTFEKNVFRGEWKDVETIPKLTLAVNELPGELTVGLARNLDSTETEYEEIELSGYDGDVLVATQNNEAILATADIAYGIGEGTDLEVDHTVHVKEYYGGYEALLTHSGEEILTHKLEPIAVPKGYPRGRNYYRGYVSDYGLVYDVDKQNTEVKLLHVSDELNNDIYRTPDILKLDNLGLYQTNGGYGFGSWFKPSEGITDNLGFSFTASATYKLKRIVIPTAGWDQNIITVQLRTGSTIGSGTLLGTAQAILNAPGGGIKLLSHAFDQAIQLTNAATYNVVGVSQFERQTLSQFPPVVWYIGST